MKPNSYKKNALTLILQKSWHTFYGLINLILINLFLKDYEIGQYYLMHSILYIQTLAELGFFNIVQANISKKIFIESEEKLKKIKLNKMMNQYACLYILISLLFILVSLIYILLFSNEKNFYGTIKYLIYALSIGINLYLQVFFTAIDGLNNIAKTAEIKIYSTLIGITLTLICCFLSFGIYAFVFGQLVISIANFVFIKNLKIFHIFPIFKFKFIKDALKNTYRLQIKYALTWLSGYLIFSLYIPFAFKFLGPIEAGIIGMTISVFSIPTSIGNALFQARMPIFSKLLEEKNYLKSFLIFKKTTVLAVISTFLTGLTLTVFITIIRDGNLFSEYSERVVPLNLLIIFVVYSSVNTYGTCLSLFFRSDNKEIFAKYSIILALLTLGCLFISKDFNIYQYIMMPFSLFIGFVSIFYTNLFIRNSKSNYKIFR